MAAGAAPALGPDAIFADLNTAAPQLKRELAELVPRFVDVALLGPVPARGLGTPSLASGPVAQEFADLVGPLGMPVEVVSTTPGDAAGMKLLRSVFMKGLAAAAIESLAGAEALGQREWLDRAARRRDRPGPRSTASSRAAACTPAAGSRRWTPPASCSARSGSSRTSPARAARRWRARTLDQDVWAQSD